MKYYNVTFKWYDTDTYCSNIAKAESVEDVKAHYAKYGSDPIITEASAYEVEAAKERGKPIISCPHIEAPAEVEEEAEPEQNTTETTENRKESGMNYTITTNPTYNSTEIVFDGKPSEEIRETLKEMRFRWHGQRRLWYGYKDEQTVRAALDGKTQSAKTHEARSVKTTKAATVNKYGVRVGDIFRASWGWEQTNNDFFQVVALCGESSVRVVEVNPPMIESEATGPMSENRVFQITRELLPPVERSVFIKDQERGDIKRLKSYAADGKSNPQFNLTSYANAYFCGGETVKVYESWYA